MTKKSSYRVVAESINNGNIAKLNMNKITRKISLAELKQIVKEEFGAVVAVADKAADVEDDCDWSDAELEAQVQWAKALKLIEAVKIK